MWPLKRIEKKNGSETDKSGCTSVPAAGSTVADALQNISVVHVQTSAGRWTSTLELLFYMFQFKTLLSAMKFRLWLVWFIKNKRCIRIYLFLRVEATIWRRDADLPRCSSAWIHPITEQVEAKGDHNLLFINIFCSRFGVHRQIDSVTMAMFLFLKSLLVCNSSWGSSTS